MTRRRPAPTARDAIRVVAIAVPMLLASACWQVSSTTPEVVTSSVGLPVAVCEAPTKTGSHTFNTELRIDWGDGTADTALVFHDLPARHCRFHTYAAAGEYHGEVRVSPGEQTADHRSLLVVVSERDPAYLGASATCTCHTRASFSAANLEAVLGPTDGAITPVTTSYTWSFGDGTTAVTSTPATTHTYARPGTYTVTVTGVRPAFALPGEQFYGAATADAVTSVHVGA